MACADAAAGTVLPKTGRDGRPARNLRGENTGKRSGCQARPEIKKTDISFVKTTGASLETLKTRIDPPARRKRRGVLTARQRRLYNGGRARKSVSFPGFSAFEVPP